MRSFVADTNLWLRSVDPESLQHSSAVIALEAITTKAVLFLIPQNLLEFWVVATRPKQANGLGWTTDRASARLAALRAKYELKADTTDLVDRWFELVRNYQVQGKRAHDARIAAAVSAIHADYLVSFNVADFNSWPVKVVHPADAPALISTA